MFEIFVMGFLLGMRHALDADHLAAVATLVSKTLSLRESVRLGSSWGLGHTVTLLVLGCVVLMMDTMIPEQLARMLEFAVGLMLLGLGMDVFRRLLKDKVHLHPHRHADGTVHLHAHAHLDDEKQVHQHRHVARFPLRALLVGIMHGLAGTAALMILALQSVQSFSMGLLFIGLFGVGSILGMALLSVVIALPLRATAQSHARFYPYLQGGIASATLLLGLHMIVSIGVVGIF